MEEISEWREYDVVKRIDHEEVCFYIERSGLIRCYSKCKYDRDEKGNYINSRFEKTYVLDVGGMEGEHIDLFDLQKWFDNNREWIDSLKVKLEGTNEKLLD